MNKHGNKRAQNTRKKIESYFLELLMEKPLEKITVQEICRGININRSTFYMHYEDIYNLFSKMEEEMSKKIAGIFYDEKTEKYRKFNITRYVELFEYVQENRSFYSLYLNGVGKNYTINIYVAQLSEKMLEVFLENALEEERKMLNYRIEFFNAGINALIRRWLSTGCKETPNELADIVVKESNLFSMW